MTAIQGDPASTAPAAPTATAPAPAAPARRSPWRQMTASFRHRNYRLFFFGQLVSMMGTWMQTVAQSFLVLGLTHSGTQLGLTTAARFLPILIVGQAGGLFADRRDKRRIMLVTQTSAGLLAGCPRCSAVCSRCRPWPRSTVAALTRRARLRVSAGRAFLLSRTVA